MRSPDELVGSVQLCCCSSEHIINNSCSCQVVSVGKTCFTISGSPSVTRRVRPKRSLVTVADQAILVDPPDFRQGHVMSLKVTCLRDVFVFKLSTHCQLSVFNITFSVKT